jgi:hypothetical protein
MAPPHPPIDLSRATWRKSARSSGNGGACIEITNLGTAVGVRDSKNPDGPKLTFPPRAWDDFIDRTRNGAYDP